MATVYKLQYTAAEIDHKLSEIEHLARKDELPSKISDLTNDSGFVTGEYVDTKIGEIEIPDASEQIGIHNVANDSHNDIRLLVEGLSNRLNALANSDDTTLDQMAEIVAYIKNNKTLIDSITTDKVNVSDIINNLTTNSADKPLSAAQGAALKTLIDAIKVPTKVSQLSNDAGYLTEQNLEGYATEEYVKNKIAEAELEGEDIDLSGYAQKSDLPTKVSQLTNDVGYLTSVPVTSVNGKTGEVNLDAEAVGALPASTKIPSSLSELKDDSSHRTVSDSEKVTWDAKAEKTDIPKNVSELVNDSGYLTEHQSLDGLATEDYVDTKIGEIPTPDVSGQIGTHNTSDAAHNDIRILVGELATRLNALANSDDTTLDQMSEVVAYIKNNKTLIDGITSSKINVSDIINNLTTNVSNKPLSAAQGVALKALIDAIVVPTKISELTNDKGYLTSVPVTSVNNKTGAVSLSASDVGALPSTTKIPSSLSDLTADTTHRTVTDAEKSAWNAKAETSSIPTKVSQLTNDAKYLTSVPSEYVTETEMQSYAQPKGNYLTAVPSEYVTETELNAKKYLTSYTETDPTVPAWAKAATKPSYTKSEVGLGNVDNVKQYSASNPPPYPVTSVNDKTGTITLTASDVGADASGTASSAVSTHNSSTSAHTDIRTAIDSKADKSEGSFFVEGSGTTDSTAKTSTWVGSSDRVTEYYDGLAIRYKIGVAGQTTTTLNINGLGAKPIYLFNTTKLTTQFPVNSIINLIYHADLNSGCWMCSDYDSNTNTYQRVYPTTTDTEYPITARYNTTTGSSYYAEYGRYSTGVTLNPSTNTITATAFKGKLTGNADTATKATQDASGNVITSTYETKTNAAAKVNEINAQISSLSSEIVDIKSTAVLYSSQTLTDAQKAQARTNIGVDTYLAEELAKRGQLKPEFANSIEECTDTSKMYVLPDGFIYAWMLTQKEVESGGGYTNVLPTATDTDGKTIYGGDYNGDGVNDGYKTETRLSGSSGSTSSVTNQYKDLIRASGFIPAKVGDVIRIKNFSAPQGVQSYVISYNGTTRVNSQQFATVTADGGWATSTTYNWYTVEGKQTGEGVTTFTLTSANFGSGFNAIRFSGTIAEDTIVTINEEIKEGGGTTIVEEWAWASTGLAFVPADYEDRIIALEEQTAENTADIATLKKGAVDTGGVDALTWIRNWDSPIYDRVPVFQLSAENPAVTSADKTVASIYAKYDALVAAHPNYITKKDLGVCSDGVTHVYRYDFREPEPHHQSGMQWSETKPVVICASGIHWEWGGVYSLYYALKAIAENPELDDLRRNVHFVVVPVINPYCFTDIGAYSETYGVLNANGVQIHRNFEVGFIYPGKSGYQELGNRNHGGTEPLSEIETKNIDNIFKEYPDAALFLTCHSAQRDTRWGTGFIWASTATNYTCNLGYRLVDKMSKAWHKKYGTTWEEGCVRENNFVLSDTATYPNATPLADGDYRAGHAHVSSTDGTETRQATKYGIQGANVEVLDTFWVLDSTNLSSKVTTHGAEVYINYLLMYMGCYDHKDKREYAV